MEQILARYEVTPFTVRAKSPVVQVVDQKDLKARSWSRRRKEKNQVDLLTELAPAEGRRFTSTPTLTLEGPPAPGLRLIEPMKQIPQPSKPKNGSRSLLFAARLEATVASGSDPIPVPVRFQCDLEGGSGKVHSKGTVTPVISPGLAQSAATTKTEAGVALIGGALELKLGHLCDQKGCVSHFHQAFRDVPGVVGLRPYPGLSNPRAIAFLRAKEAVDLWGLREGLRQQSIEVTGVIPKEMKYRLRVELVRWQTGKSGAAQQSESHRKAVRDVISPSWSRGAQVAGGGLTFRPSRTDRDLIELLNGITKTGIAPAAVWLVPEGAPMPKASPPRPLPELGKTTDAATPGYASIQLDVENGDGSREQILAALGRQKWADEAHLTLKGNTVTGWLRPRARTYAPLMPLLNQFRDMGQAPGRIRLQGFDDVRVTLDFAHLCGEVEMSKPPKRKPSGKPGSKPDRKPLKKFVPKPLRPAKSSNARKAIEAALKNVIWVREATYHDYHTRPTFKGPTKLSLALRVKGEDIARLDALIDELRKAGFPPSKVMVSRLFPGLAFGNPVPNDLALADAEGKKLPFSSLHRGKKPLVVAFVSLNSPRRKYRKHKPRPELYSQLKETIEKYKGKATFVAISANPKDSFPDAISFLKKAGLTIPVLHDSGQRIRKVLNVQNAPAPHLFIFDGEGLLRYAGDPHDRWTPVEKRKQNFLDQALQQVLAGKYKANGAAFYNSSRCNCSSPKCKCPKCGCGPSCRCAGGH